MCERCYVDMRCHYHFCQKHQLSASNASTTFCCRTYTNSFRKLFMPFCGTVINYVPCVPKYQVSTSYSSRSIPVYILTPWRPLFLPNLIVNVCPYLQVLPPSREYPDGRFYNNTVLKKDTWIQDTYNDIIGRRKNIERSKTWKKLRKSISMSRSKI